MTSRQIIGRAAWRTAVKLVTRVLDWLESMMPYEETLARWDDGEPVDLSNKWSGGTGGDNYSLRLQTDGNGLITSVERIYDE